MFGRCQRCHRPTIGLYCYECADKILQERIEKAMEKVCASCKYKDVWIGAHPCDTCKHGVKSKNWEPSEDQFDTVDHPPHYKTGGIEPIDYMKAKLTKEQFDGFLIGNVIKYVSRYSHKNGLEDLKKARWYLDKLIEEIEKAP